MFDLCTWMHILSTTKLEVFVILAYQRSLAENKHIIQNYKNCNDTVQFILTKLPDYIAYFIELCRNDIFQIGLDNTRYYQWLIHLIVKENTSNMRAKISFSGKFNYLESHLLVQKVMLLIIYSLYFGTESLPLHQHQAQMKPTLFNVRAAHK